MLAVTNFPPSSTRKNKFKILTNRKKSNIKDESTSKVPFTTNMMIIQKIKFIDNNYDKLKRNPELNYINSSPRQIYSLLSKSLERVKPKNIEDIEKNIAILNEDFKIVNKKSSPMISNLPMTMNKKQKLPSISSLTKIPKTIRLEPSSIQIRIQNTKNSKENLANSNSRSPQKKNKGNNKDMIKNILLKRPNWKESTSDMTTVYNFKWSTSRKGFEFCLLNNKVQKRLLNHFEFDPEISNKKFMFLNFLEYCEKNTLNVFDYLPFTLVIKINGNNFKENFKKFEEMMKNIKNYVGEDSNKLTQVYNYSEIYKSDILNYKHYNSKIYIPTTHYSGKNIWLVKPTDLYGGKCIQITDTPEEMEKMIKKFFEGIDKSNKQEEESISESDSSDTEEVKHKYQASTVLIQKYIESPLLYYGRKFDIRMWVLIDHNMGVFLFKEGHLKTTSTQYTTETKDKFVHITNYSLQKHNNNFEKFEEGNEVSFAEFQNCLDVTFPESKYQIKKDIYPQMVEIIRHSTLAIKNKINRKDRKYCYVILGYDFMIDINMKVWLIEINKNPGLVDSSAIIKALVPRMIDDSFRLTVDMVYGNPTVGGIYLSPYHVDGYSDEENMFEYLHSLS